MENQLCTGILFSYNRAMQLDALLRSFLAHCQDCADIRLTVIYKTSGDLHAHQYQRLTESYKDNSNISFQREVHFRSDVIQLLAARKPGFRRKVMSVFAARVNPILHNAFQLTNSFNKEGFVLFLVDDALFIREFNLQDILRVVNDHPDALGFSLRLGINTNYCYAKDRLQSIPQFVQIHPGVIKFRWVTAEADFAYPLEVSSSVYRVRDILPLLLKLNYQNPNLLEGRMAARAKEFASTLPKLLCFEQSVAFCNPVNKVQIVYNNRSGLNPEYSSNYLAELYERGYRIDIQAYDGFVPNGVHQETEIIFRTKS